MGSSGRGGGAGEVREFAEGDDVAGGLVFLDDGADVLGNLLLGIGWDVVAYVDDLGDEEEFGGVLAVNLVIDNHAGVAKMGDAGAEVDHVVDAGGGLVFEGGLGDDGVEVTGLGDAVDGVAEVAEILGLGDFEEAHVGAEEGDALGVALGPADAEGGGEAEVGPRHVGWTGSGADFAYKSVPAAFFSYLKLYALSAFSYLAR